MSKTKLAARLAAVQESATLALNARVKQMTAAGKTVYNLTAGELAGDTPAYIQSAVARTLVKNKYTPVAGLPELRGAIADHCRQFYGLDWIQADNVVVTSGAKPAIFASLLALINPGDKVIVPVPGWTTTYTPLIELAGGKVVEVPLSEKFDLDITAIKSQLSSRTKMIVINSPNNPTGSIYSSKALNALKSLLKDRDIVVLADDIYSKLVYETDFTSVPSVNYENIVIINGFSKSQALTGWRIGYLVAPEPIAKAATSLLSHITGNASLPAQYAGLEAMNRQDQPPAATIDELKHQLQLVIDGLNDCGIKFVRPGGAFYVMLDIRDYSDSSADWCERLLVEAGVALVPGEAFSAPGFARLTFATDELTLKSALAAIQGFVGA